MITLDKRTPPEICSLIAAALRKRRKDARLSQEKLAVKSGVSLGSLKRFERTGEISLLSLVKLATALQCQNELEQLFAKRIYSSIEDIIDAQSEET